MTVPGPKRLPIDWDDLEVALTWRTGEGGHFLDLETGEVIWAGRDDEDLSKSRSG